ncbi:MAG: hypothetical protein NXI18_15420 [Alphaproteobacteria bacterium]|nr:hypothetical protein [Alphaproteobacteria bacterium]
MDDTAASGALSEIALALAMAFFCLLVLTLVSVGDPAGGGALSAAPRIDTAERGGTDRPVADNETLIIFHNGRFLDHDAVALDPATLPDGPLVLAVDPALSVDAVLAARAVTNEASVTVTTLDSAWVRRLAGGSSGAGEAR